MTSIVLGTGGAVFGGAVGGPLGVAIGYTLGSYTGERISGLLPGGRHKVGAGRGRRLADLSVQTSTYGKMIPVIYGSSRVAGNVIWSLPIKETAMVSRQGGKGGGSGRVSSTTSYSYSVTLAIALCEGVIDEVVRVWADAEIVDISGGVYRLYKGDEAQLPDPLIESYQGVGTTPAYRGLAYVVLEDFPLENFGNRIPNFTFEVKKRVATVGEEQAVEELITSMIMIPGSGEFVYDTVVQNKIPGDMVEGSWVQRGTQSRINQNNREGKADSLVSLDQLQNTCKNLEWVAPVVAWFADNLDAGECLLKPGVEYQEGAITSPDSWQVAGFSRETAYLINQDAYGNPVYGGTVNDASLLRYLDELRSRGLKIMFYPLFFMDTENKPWRGRLTGSAADVADFFTKTHGYNDFILHYANLVAGKVDAFIIGSELIGLTQVNDGENNFPAVEALVSLAASVKAILGSEVKLTYAADWSEYHHTAGGWYNMDPLWASDDIDMVGIDAYFPLTNSPQAGYDVQAVMDGWTSGEGYDFVYSDEERTTTEVVSPEYAWKNIGWWWSNSHNNPDGNPTDWVPESKKIWFTEYGFPSVDGATNQPNVFYDPSSSESYFPRFSKGRVDIRAQRLGLTATELKWQDSAMVERKFVWTWDARPFPFWPDLRTIWSDGGLWRTGHWVAGKLGLSALAAVVTELARRAGLAEEDMDVSRLTDLLEGYTLSSRDTVRSLLEELQSAYFFDAVETGGKLAFIPRGGEAVMAISDAQMVPEGKGDKRPVLELKRLQELLLPQRCDVTYLNKYADYQVGTQSAQRLSSHSLHQASVDLPLVLTDQAAKNIADISLYNSWLERTQYRFALPVHYALLEPGDVVTLTSNNITHSVRITRTRLGAGGVLQVEAVAEDVSIYDVYSEPALMQTQTQALPVIGKTMTNFLDVPAFPGDSTSDTLLRVAANGYEARWHGMALYRSDDAGLSYVPVADVNDGAVMGTAITALGTGSTVLFDGGNSVTVVLTGGELETVSQLAVLNGANAAMIGEEILQFTSATLVEPYKYVLSGLLRGRLGTEDAVSGHVAGERFVLLDNRLAKIPIPTGMIGLARQYKPVSFGRTLGQTDVENFTYYGVMLKPYAPVHISGVRDMDGNLAVSWIRRTRINGEWQDNTDVPLAEESECYDVEVMNGAEVVRSFSAVTEATVTYSAAAQMADFGEVQNSVSLRVYQLSAIVGRGKVAVVVV